ncbi:MAG: YkgJ family cysteine cluster protein [Candidatus Bathyarchaeota archaeon]
MEREIFDFPEGILWKCRRCSKCCGDTPVKERRILLLSSEARHIREVVKIPLKKFCQRTGFKPFALEMKKNSSGKCFFLKDNKCQIYSQRPLICRFYPFWLEKSEDGNFSFKVTYECTGIGSGQILEEAFFINLFHLANDKINISYTPRTKLTLKI